MKEFNIPLMSDNVNEGDINALISFLQQRPIPQLTNGPKVREFEAAWSKWVGVKYSIFVNSGSAANELTMLGIKYLYGDGEIIVPPLTWVSDISSVINVGLTPVFCDINLKNLSFDISKLRSLINEKTKAVFLTHVLGLNGLTEELVSLCREKNIPLIEDCCESHGAEFQGTKVGSFGFASNFSFYFAHHLSTIEGGMICTNDEKFYQILRCCRSHGMLREATDEGFKVEILSRYPELNKDFVFIAPAHNFRSTELNAVLGLSQLKRLDANNQIRKDNFGYFLRKLDPSKYMTAFDMDGQCNYAFIVILNRKDLELRDKIESVLSQNGIEFRRGLSGGGSQIKQPYAKERFKIDESHFPNMEHVHHFSWYIGNYPSLEREKIDFLISVLNNIYE